jgi:hypothetical protein
MGINGRLCIKIVIGTNETKHQIKLYEKDAMPFRPESKSHGYKTDDVIRFKGTRNCSLYSDVCSLSSKVRRLDASQVVLQNQPKSN